MLPPQEIKEGVLQVVRTNLGGSQDEVSLAVSRLLGFKATSAQLREAVQSAVTALISQGMLMQHGDYLVLVGVKSTEASNG